MNRSLVLNIHLALSSLFIPFLLIIPLSGSMYLLGFKGEVKKTQVLQIEGTVPGEMKDKEAYFRELFSTHKIDYDFEYIKDTPAELIFRPTSSDYYTAVVKDGTVTLFEAQPNLVSKMMELHKGHGPGAMKKFQMAFGFALVLILLSGLMLAMTVKKFRNLSLISFSVGLVLLGIFLIV